jgi:hypothetical protein
MAARSPIKGKVIRILSPDSFIVDIGSKDGTKREMGLVIYEEGQDIFGLDGKSLGKIEFVKASLRITHVQENFSVAESAETEDATTISGSIATSLTFKKSLPVAQKQIDPLTSFDKTIKKGDLVRSI